MKKTLKLIAVLLAAISADCAALAQTDSGVHRNDVKLVEHTVIAVDRSAFPSVNVQYNEVSVYVEGSELKDANIYLLNFNGVIVHQSIHYFGIMPDTYIIDAPSFPGKYYIIIDSPVLYAEGMFEVRK